MMMMMMSTTADKMSSYQVGLLGIPQDSKLFPNESVHGPNMVEFKGKRDSNSHKPS